MIRGGTGPSICVPASRGPKLDVVTRDEALAECLRLTREAPDRDLYEYIPHEAEDGSWHVVKTARPEFAAAEEDEGS